MNGYGRAMSRYADFQGRASRSELWWFTGVLAAMAFVALLIDGAIAQETQKGNYPPPCAGRISLIPSWNGLK